MRRRGFLLGLLASMASVPLARTIPQPVVIGFDLASSPSITAFTLLDIEWKSDKAPSLWEVSWARQPQFGDWRTTTIVRGP